MGRRATTEVRVCIVIVQRLCLGLRTLVMDSFRHVCLHHRHLHEKDYCSQQFRTQPFAHTALLPFESINQSNSPINTTSYPDLITDENDHVFHGSWETDFGEGMKSILDIVHPDLTYPEKGEKLPTFMFPFRGGSGILSDSHNNSNHGRRTSVTSHNRGMYDGRQ